MSEMFKSVITSGQATMRYIILINGGACMAILAFISGIYEKDEILARCLAGSLGIFGFGVLLGALVSGVTYISQHTYQHEEDEAQPLANWWRRVAIILAAGSYVSFAIGGIVTIISIR